MSVNPIPSSSPRRETARRLAVGKVPLALLTIVLIGVGAVSTYAFATFVLDGFIVLCVVLPPALTGIVLMPQRRLGTLPLRWRLLAGAALGIGGLCILVMVMGCTGLLSRRLWLGILGVLFLFGVIRLRTVPIARNAPDHQRDPLRWLILLLAPLLILGILCAVHAPGFLWSEEGFGYDALEYHLALPKAYHAGGVISYVPHNVYANFPANVEMLYLLGMVLLDQDMEAGTTAHLIHLTLGVLTVLGAYVGGCEWSRRGGLVSALTMGSAGWMVYLSGLAYVEHGLLLFGTVAGVALLRAFALLDTAPQADDRRDTVAISTRWFGLSGLFAGLACGCKYTGVPMIALPIVLAPLWTREPLVQRLRFVLVAGAAGAIAFSPWLIKNAAMTGNPVFPLANRIFQAEPEGWGMAESAHWDRCHAPGAVWRGHADADDGQGCTAAALSDRVERLWTNVLADRYGRFGPMVFVLAITGFLVRRDYRRSGALAWLLVVQLLVWLFATHLYARFAVPLLIPLALLAGRCAWLATNRSGTVALAGILVAGVSLNVAHALQLYRSEAMPGAVAPAALIYEGTLPGYEHLAVINGALPQDARVLVVGDAKAFYYDRSIAYSVVFNRSPFVTAAEQDPSPQNVGVWLHEHGFTHVFVDWAEIHRLRTSAYGFPAVMEERWFAALEASGVIRTVGLNTREPVSTKNRLYEVTGG